ncbi:hypothetical protein ACOZ38_36280 [Sphaerisporangium viridialbum]|uniref:hypothetical protein n=1 Tax=Sphaerisporangium viridialbum TaxID=46189 RepID=UPI003C796DE8
MTTTRRSTSPEILAGFSSPVANWWAWWANWRANSRSEAVTSSPVEVVTRTDRAPKSRDRTGVRAG